VTCHFKPTLGSRLSTLAATCLGFLVLAGAPAAYADPAWYRHKQQVEEKKAEETAEKDAERPVVGIPGEGGSTGGATNTFSQLSKPIENRIETNLLFKRAGLTDSIGFDLGKLDQTDISGYLFSAQLAMGYWWQPNLVLSVFARPSVLFRETYLYMAGSAGPSLRYLLGKHWAFTGAVAYGFGQGLTRVSSTHIPPPPDDVALVARRGILNGAQVAYFFWPKRDLGIGPCFSYWGGKLGDRDNTIFTLGFTLQDQRPNYTGEL
jgi:hypothetical protein